MAQFNKAKVLAGRKAIDAYRKAHTKLYEKGWHKGIPQEHTPLLETYLKAFNGLGFVSLDDFFDTSNLLNAQELGYKDWDDFTANATDEDIEKWEEMWN